MHTNLIYILLKHKSCELPLSAFLSAYFFIKKIDWSRYMEKNFFTVMCKFRLIHEYLSAHNEDIVVKRNYPVLSIYSQYGRGDLVMDCGDCIRVIEFAYLDRSQHGKTASRRRTYKRNKVVEQARLYAAFCKVQYPDRRVEAYTVTNEKTTKVSDDVNIEKAKNRVIQFIINAGMGCIPTVVMPALVELFATLRAFEQTAII